MRGTRTMRRTVAGLAVAALVGLAGCGGGDEDGDGGPEELPAGELTGTEFLGHELREVPADAAPGLALEVTADEHGGWNLHLRTERFTFTPEQVGGRAIGGEGHAHVYVDQEKFGRVYAEWYFLPTSAVPEGEHELLVTLNADDHSVWAPGGEPLTATATVTGGMDGGHHHDGATPSPDGSPTAEPDALFEFEVAGGQASPPLDRATVAQGSAVRIVVTSDVADEVHLHGYDLEAHLEPGQPGVIEFTADQTGLFELETHETGLVLLQLVVE